LNYLKKNTKGRHVKNMLSATTF